MSTYAIVGTGAAPTPVITEGLSDCLTEDDLVVIEWGSISASLKAVYKYLRDNGVPFRIYYREGQSIPAEIRDLENCEVVKHRYPLDTMLSISDVVLFLWDDAENTEQHPPLIDYVFDHIEKSVPVKELTNGLAPIVIDDNIPEPEPAPVDEEDDKEDWNFTREELEVATAAVVKQYGQRKGCVSKTKSGIIDELFGGTAPDVTIAPSVEGADDDTYPPTVQFVNPIAWEEELVTILRDFREHHKPGFNSDMAHLALGQARLWMLKSLAEG